MIIYLRLMIVPMHDLTVVRSRGGLARHLLASAVRYRSVRNLDSHPPCSVSLGTLRVGGQLRAVWPATPVAVCFCSLVTTHCRVMLSRLLALLAVLVAHVPLHLVSLSLFSLLLLAPEIR